MPHVDDHDRGKERRRDERWETLKRRVQLLARVDGPLLRVAEGLVVARVQRVSDPARVVTELRARGVLSLSTLEAAVTLERPPVVVTRELLSAAQRDLRALALGPSLALARERRRALARYADAIDEAWLKARTARLSELATAFAALGPPREASDWFDGVVELVRAAHGAESSERLAVAKRQVAALGAERRRFVQERIEALALSVETGTPPADADLVDLAERLERASELPGRARRTRTLDVLRKAIAWPEAPASAAAHLAAPLRGSSFADAVREAGRAMMRALPAARDPILRERSLDMLAWYALAFRVGSDGVPFLSMKEVDAAIEKRPLASKIFTHDLTVAQALRLLELPMKRWPLEKAAGWVARGVELELLEAACKAGHAEALGCAENERAARAFAIWATKLLPEYKRLGVDLQLSTELFNHLPRNEDAALLAVCLVEQARQSKGERTAAGSDPVAVLDATLGMFQKLPHKASGILARLKGTSPGAGRRAFPDFSAWLGDDDLLDRFVHLARIAKSPVALTKQMREDFDHAAKASRERAHLEGLVARSARQEARLDTLRRHDRSLGAAPRGRTKRRLRERIDELLPLAYRRELDAVFAEIMREAWGIVVPAMTPAWRDAVRFWLVIDDNRSLLAELLRKASAAPGRDVKRAFPKSIAWLERVGGKIDVGRWTAPRSTTVAASSRAFTIALEEDPLEVLRMGIPFDTCLSLESGCNAASTVMNAIDANKRVIYARTSEGKIVGRKLIGITPGLTLVGYNTYVSVTGAEERAIRGAIEEMCRAISAEVGVPFAREGKPEELHTGFWYDDGTVPWADNADVASYCASLGLAPPAKTFDSLVTEAQRAKAIEEGDVVAAIATLTRWDEGPSNVDAGRWVVDRLGPAEAVRRSAEHDALVPAVLRTLGRRDERSMIEALRLAPRMDARAVGSFLPNVLAGHPRSATLARALAEMTVRVMRVLTHHDNHGIGHVAFDELAELLDGIEPSFDVLDIVEPAWNDWVEQLPECAPCKKRAWGDCIYEVRWIHRTSPDPDAVVRCLMSRHRGELAQRAALAIAGEVVLPGGARALSRLAALRPGLQGTAALLKARLRQEGIVRVTEAIAKKLPRVRTTSAVSAIGAALFQVAGIEHLVPDDDAWVTGVADLEAWSPGPWELAWLRRRPAKRLREQLRAIAARKSGVSAALEKLALLGDVETIEGHAARVAAGTVVDRAPEPVAPRDLKPITDYVKLAHTLREQVEHADRGKMPKEVEPTRFVDRRLLEVAFDIVREARMDDGYGVALEVVAKHRDHRAPWGALVAALVRRRDAHALSRILEEKCPYEFSVEEMVEMWQVEGAREAFLVELTAGAPSDWCPRIAAFERHAAERGLSMGDLFERTALRLVEHGPLTNAVETETLDQLRTVIRVATTLASPERAAALYEELPDELAASCFVRAVKRLPVDRATAIRAAVEKLKLHGERGAARREWLRGTRSLKKRRASSIERE